MTVTTYETNGFIKFVEEDIYEDGCQPSTAKNLFGDDKFKSASLEDLIKQIKDFTGCKDDENLLLNSCDELGRLDVQVYETKSGKPATPAKMEQWKQGTEKLWLACYSFRVEAISVSPIDLEMAKQHFPTATIGN